MHGAGVNALIACQLLLDCCCDVGGDGRGGGVSWHERDLLAVSEMVKQ